MLFLIFDMPKVKKIQSTIIFYIENKSFCVFFPQISDIIHEFGN